MVTFQVNSNVYVNDISILKWPTVWNAVTHHVVYRRTHRLGKSTVVQWRGISIVSDRLLVHDEVDFVCCHTNLEAASGEEEDVSSKLTCSPQTLNLLLIVNLNIVRPLGHRAGGDVARLLDVLGYWVRRPHHGGPNHTV